MFTAFLAGNNPVEAASVRKCAVRSVSGGFVSERLASKNLTSTGPTSALPFSTISVETPSPKPTAVVAPSLLATFSFGDSAILDRRIKGPLRSALLEILDSAGQAGLPINALADKALEGVSKGAPPSRVLWAVQTLRMQFDTVRRALRPITVAELDAATTAYRSGVPATTLAQVQRALPRRSLIIPYAVLSALVRRGIPLADAVKAVVSQAGRANDQSLLALSTATDRNLAAGLPARAALLRAQESPTIVSAPDKSESRERP